MQGFKTVEEKAEEWNVSARHVQYLCKKGKIAGAMKKVGAWFIPDDAPIPIKNTKSNAPRFQFVGTKRKIFDNAIALFMLHGFENVSVKDIASAVGIRQSAIYNHFKSKQEILDTIYDFYCHHYVENRPVLEALEPILEHGSLLDIIMFNTYQFSEDYIQRMSDITKIIFRRNSVDERAREINKALIIDEGINFVEAVFKRAIGAGRIAPIDTRAMSVYINSIRLYTLNVWVVDSSPESIQQLVDDEQTQYKYAAALLTDLRPPRQA